MIELKDTLNDLQYQFKNTASKDVTFRLLTKSDVFPLFNATKNPEFNQHLLWNAPKNVSDLVPEIEKLIRQSERGEMLVLSMCLQETGTWFGFLKFAPFRDTFEITYWVHPNFWSKKITVEACLAAISTYFENSNLDILYCRAKKDNNKMIKMLVFFGFEKIDDMYATHENGHQLDLDISMLKKTLYKHRKLVFSY